MSLYDKQKLNRKRKLQTNHDQVDQTPERSTRKTSDWNRDSSKYFFAMLQSRMKSFIFVKPFMWVWGSERWPVYALGKQVQWMYPDRFENFVWMMDPLDIEMALLNAIGDCLEGSGWLGVFKKAKISIPGRVDSFLSGSHVKRSWYAHVISLFALRSMVQEVFQESDCSSYKDWENQLKSKSVNARYWFTVLELETLLFMFIRSLRSADFDLFRRCLKEIIPWMFALDHVHYSRWLSVFLHDLERLEDTNENIFQNFMEGRFVVNKSGKPFSCIAEDQAHEQNNKRIKGDGGAVGILDSEEALLKRAISGPVLANLLEQGETKKLGKMHIMRTLICMRRLSEKKDQGMLKSSRRWQIPLEKMKNA